MSQEQIEVAPENAKRAGRKVAKVLFIVTRLNIGGVTKHVVRLAKGLSELGYEVWLATGQTDAHEGDMRFYALQHEVEILTIPELGRAIRWSDDVKALLALFRLIRRLRPDIVHTHTAKAGTLGRIAARLLRVKCIVHTFHGHVFRGYFSATKTRFILTIEKILARLTHNIIALSELQKQELSNIFKIAPESKITVIPLSIDEEDVNTDKKANHGGLRQELGLAREAKIAAAIGRIVAIKNPELFLRIAQNIHARRGNVHFVFIGGGEAEREARALANEFGLAEIVHFLGWRKDIAALYREIDLLLIASKNEGTPYTILEAMAAGCPVVATKVGGIPDLIRHRETGLLFESQDVEAGTAAVEEILSDSEFKQHIIRNAQKIVGEQFSPQRCLASIDEMYQGGLS